jgi:AAA15 family ATPase/GTPase
MLENLRIENFRLFESFQIEKLARVNLIVGKNNVGKSSLLEALALYAANGSPKIIQSLLAARDEGEGQTLDHKSLKHLFYGREDFGSECKRIEIGPIDLADKLLSISNGWFGERINEQGFMQLRLLSPDEYAAVMIPGIVLTKGEQRLGSFPFFLDGKFHLPQWNFETELELIGVYGAAPADVSRIWDKIALTDLEQEVLTALKIVAPEVERVNLVGGHKDNQERIPIVKIAGQSSPIPLRSMGEGSYRLFGLVLALVNAKDGFLLVDEIDTGLHYRVITDMWRLVFEAANWLNVQVFATTHSWDCVESFAEALDVQEDKAAGQLIRLSRRGEKIVPVHYDYEDLSIVTEQNIEVR